MTESHEPRVAVREYIRECNKHPTARQHYHCDICGGKVGSRTSSRSGGYRESLFHITERKS